MWVTVCMMMMAHAVCIYSELWLLGLAYIFIYRQMRAIRTCGHHKNKSEEECRRVLEYYFHRPFNTQRPEWLINPRTGRRLELDCYNEDLAIAIEYDGAQHASYNERFHSSPTQFSKQQERDRLKEELCAARGVKLIRVPHTTKNIKPFLLKAL
jgi:hypothetical protein